MNLRLGMFSGAIREWPIGRFAEAAAAAGFQALEWELRTDGHHIAIDQPAAGARRCRQAAEKVGLPVCAVSAGPDVSLLDDSHVAALVEACREAGATVARAFAPSVDQSVAASVQLAAVEDALRRHSDGFDAHGVTLVIELSQETLLPSPELLRRVCEHSDPRAVGALYDPANMVVEGNLPPWLTFEILGPYLHHVHVKNEAFIRTGDTWAADVVPLADGLVEWRAVFGELDRRDYRGWVVMDHLSGPPSEQRIAVEKHAVDAAWQERR